MPTSEGTIQIAIREICQYLRLITESTSTTQEHLAGAGAVAKLEQKLRRHYDMRFALCVSNATTGLLVAGLALGLRDSEFITTPYTYGASIAGLLLLGNVPCFADIESTTLGLDPASVCETIRPSTKAIVAVDIDGIPSDMEGLRRLASEHGLLYIADASQSLGATRRGLAASSLADVVVVSFTTGKTLFAGEGGAVLTNNPDVYDRLLWYSQHPNRQKLELGLSKTNEFALNARIHPLAAVWANATFRRSLEELKFHQERCLAILRIVNTSRLTVPLPFESEDIVPAFFRLTAAWKNRPDPENLQALLHANGFSVDVSTVPVELLYRQAAFKMHAGRAAVRAGRCPAAELQARNRFLIALRQAKSQPARSATEFCHPPSRLGLATEMTS